MVEIDTGIRWVEYLIIGAAVIAGIGYVLPWWFRGRDIAGLEAELVQLCYGDRLQADLLVAGEMARRPGITRDDAVVFALAQLRRDRG